MSQIVIRAEGIGKKYRIRHQARPRYTALRDVIADRVGSLFRPKPAGVSRESVEDFWALRNVGFEISRGEVVGIIGRNGAGKSTLLKVLSRITEPSEGRVELDGRVASLLEVGTGFHPELTGRENIFLNGSILGMTAREIRQNLDAIVAFADIERFLDTPVKRYSSGMYVRLAFSVAAHMAPDILIVDEVLAVGDAEFQKKCIGKMHEVSRGGRTVLFVSHNMGAIQALCTKAMYLTSGETQGLGNVDSLIAEYLKAGQGSTDPNSAMPKQLSPTLAVRACDFEPNPLESGRSGKFRLEISSTDSIRISELALTIHAQQGYRVSVLDFRASGLPSTISSDRPWEISGEIRNSPLVEGDYMVGIYLHAGDFVGEATDLATLRVGPRSGELLAPYPAAHRGVLETEFHVDHIGSRAT